MTTSEFITLCDCTPQKPFKGDGLLTKYDIETEAIKKPLSVFTGEGAPYKEFKNLRRAFIYLSIIDKNKNYEPYFYVLEKIGEHFNGSTKYLKEWTSQAWRDVVGYIKTLPEYPKTNAFVNEFMYIRERERAYAAVRLTQYGVSVKVEDNEIIFENIDAAYNRIENLFHEIGGKNALHLLISSLPYSKDFGRYLIPHQGNQVMPSMTEIETPYGYLYNLCVRFIQEEGTGRNTAHNWEELIELCKDLCLAVYDSLKFDIWTDIIFDKHDVVRIMHEMVLRYNMYTLPQTNASFTLDWCRYICKAVLRDTRCIHILKAKIQQFQIVMNSTVELSNNESCKIISKTSKESRALIKNSGLISEQIFVQEVEANKGFLKPDEMKSVNIVRYPIIESSDGFVLLPKPLVIWNWYEALFNIIKIENSTLAKDLGYIMENYIHNKMCTHGMISHSGEYTYNDTTGEVDFVIEATCGDAIIESKKKALSHDARTGDDYYIWGDLLEVIESQMQCSRLEYGVKHHSPILLTDKKEGSTYTYSWKEEYNTKDSNGADKRKQRYILKVSMTLKEYGPMQDKIVFDNIIRSLRGVELHVVFDPTDAVHKEDDRKSICKTIDKLNGNLVKLTDYYNKSSDDNPTFFCRFYNMEQLYFLIRQAKSQDHFHELLTGSYATTGTENFWNEYINIHQTMKL